MAELVTIEEALSLVLGRAEPLPLEPVALGTAAGRVLGEPAFAEVDLPPFPSSAMDGFALLASETPGTFPVAVRIAAGRPAAHPLVVGEAMGIATGGVVPDGADAVVPLEHVVDYGDRIEVHERIQTGANIRRRGGDVVAGAEVLPAGVRLGAAQIAALAAAGVADVRCSRRPRVALVATGTELRTPGEPLGPGEIYESNGVMIDTALRSAGGLVERVATVADDEDAHREALERGLDADVLVTSGGVSVGPHDLVRRIERELGVDEIFWGVAMRPGKPVSFGVRGATLVFGLPGNPVSSLVACELFVRPALLALQGCVSPGPEYAQGELGLPVRRPEGRDELLRARAVAGPGGVVLTPVTGQGSHQIVRAAAANALVRIPQGEGELPAGTQVRYLRLD